MCRHTDVPFITITTTTSSNETTSAFADTATAASFVVFVIVVVVAAANLSAMKGISRCHCRIVRERAEGDNHYWSCVCVEKCWSHCTSITTLNCGLGKFRVSGFPQAQPHNRHNLKPKPHLATSSI